MCVVAERSPAFCLTYLNCSNFRSAEHELRAMNEGGDCSHPSICRILDHDVVWNLLRRYANSASCCRAISISSGRFLKLVILRAVFRVVCRDLHLDDDSHGAVMIARIRFQIVTLGTRSPTRFRPSPMWFRNQFNSGTLGQTSTSPSA
jgi:hypothetical protein